ncbi:hypothetical protein HPP92_024352 [Vanilla planifolia]|uniref:Uncharacterized protein n=1 Tax=Vanilla planifolia TaxID=51239 RepID=A0A835PJH9_VANPL|nr:hypothetical protein HPP92_024352 [Vanilla planifolia]
MVTSTLSASTPTETGASASEAADRVGDCRLQCQSLVWKEEKSLCSKFVKGKLNYTAKARITHPSLPFPTLFATETDSCEPSFRCRNTPGKSLVDAFLPRTAPTPTSSSTEIRDRRTREICLLLPALAERGDEKHTDLLGQESSVKCWVGKLERDEDAVFIASTSRPSDPDVTAVICHCVFTAQSVKPAPDKPGRLGPLRLRWAPAMIPPSHDLLLIS